MKIRTAATTVTGVLVFASQASALTVLLDYTHDTSTDNFFNTHPVAKAALEAARNDIQSAITTILNPIVNDVTSVTFNTTTANYNFSLGYTNPSTGAAESIALSTMGADQVRVFVGMRELSGSTLGQGGPGSAGLSIGGSGSPADWLTTVSMANAAATGERLRGGGPHINTLSGIVTLGGAPATAQVNFGSAIGNLWFDNDTNNDGFTDGDPALDAYWHFDHTAAVAAGKADFYSVALHELLHGLGFGTSTSWNNRLSGSNWTGPEVIALQGNGTGLVDSGGAHIASGILSPRLSDSVLQETVMSPSITLGTRKTLTALDLAFLRDINWQTIPEPGTWTLSLAAVTGLLLRRKRKAV